MSLVNELNTLCEVRHLIFMRPLKAHLTKTIWVYSILARAGIGGHCIPVDLYIFNGE
ncbi:hypothetical protein CW304_23050 [Bacillus sp. UFRGS-B20]|nr:hypothetical protein CW304_23050 [Bacillus sp. UFRGS-B20]